MNDILDYIFNNMKKLDTRQDRIIRVLNKCRSRADLSCNIAIFLYVFTIWKALRDGARTVVLIRKIEELEKRLNEYTEHDEEV